MSSSKRNSGLPADPIDVAALMDEGVPCWSRIDFEVACARCAYDLRMLTEPRCPECGLTFDWPRVLIRHGRESDFLFEHQWRERPIGSYVLTLWRALRPHRFWGRVSIHDHIQPRPLWFLFFTAPLVLIGTVSALVAGGWGVAVLVERRYARTAPWTQFIADDLAALFDSLWERVFTEPHALFSLVMPPWVALLMVASLRQTLGRCRLRRAHILRIAAYNAASVYFAWAVVFVGTILAGNVVDAFSRRWLRQYDWIFGVASLVLCTVSLAWTWHAGLRCYARLPHTVGLAVTAAFLGVLFTATVQAVRAWL